MNASRACICAVSVLCVSTYSFAVSIDLVTVGNPGNDTDPRYARSYTGNSYDPPGFGDVAYSYQIDKFEITAGQYTEFLNAVAQTDTYGLYNANMAAGWNLGCNIQRTGDSGSYSYSVASDWANRPVNYVSWGSAARFVNWLSNGQPTGDQNSSTTEDGSYSLNGATTFSALLAVARDSNATWVIPSENEWYKAAYYDPNKPGGAGYWDYPTRSDSAPSTAISATGTNNANYYGTPAGQYRRTEVGTFAGSAGPYGTFDQGGNVNEWTEAKYYSSSRELAGGSFSSYWPSDLAAFNFRVATAVTNAFATGGFRVAYVPEPATLLLIALGGAVALKGRRSLRR